MFTTQQQIQTLQENKVTNKMHQQVKNATTVKAQKCIAKKEQQIRKHSNKMQCNTSRPENIDY